MGLICCGGKPDAFPPMPKIETETLWSTETLKAIAGIAVCPYILICMRPEVMAIGYRGVERMIEVLEATSAAMVYADYEEKQWTRDGARPLIDYRKGSLRDDFDFGPLLLFRTSVYKELVATMDDYRYAALYDLRLRLSQRHTITHIREYLCSVDRSLIQTGQFAYLDPKNREAQLEMEQACTSHLKAIGAYLPMPVKEIDFNESPFEVEASIIIPADNRLSTVRDAILSAVMQQATFPFNVIVVNNHSYDGTTRALESFDRFHKFVQFIPKPTGLNMGGCWNEGLLHPSCGKFAVMLDSDDEYSGNDTLQKIVDAFYAQKCAMLTGAYQVTDINKQPIPPGIIDHREWTPENGHNNALRVNGFGAPCAYYTPIARRILFPNTNFAADYAMGLRLSREYPVGRLYDVLSFNRRWKGNSNPDLTQSESNKHNAYKDDLRTWELEIRTKLNNPVG